jgi:hypothetical protein
MDGVSTLGRITGAACGDVELKGENAHTFGGDDCAIKCGRPNFDDATRLAH